MRFHAKEKGIFNVSNSKRKQEGGALDIKFDAETFKKFFDTAKAAKAAYTSETGTMLRNMIPAGDETARPQFANENHAILQLPNGKIGTANYMGPGTQVLQRLKRGDPPRNPVDQTAQMHDTQYQLSRLAPNKEEQSKLVREADNRMIQNLQRVKDTPFNKGLGIAFIKGKMIGEDLGVIDKTAYVGSLTKLSNADENILLQTKADLEQKGYGLPGENLKNKLLKSTRKMKVAGETLSYNLTGANGFSGVSRNKTFVDSKPFSYDYTQQGDGGDLENLIKTKLIPNILESLGVKPNILHKSLINMTVDNILENLPLDNKNQIVKITKGLLPLIGHGYMKSMKQPPKNFSKMLKHKPTRNTLSKHLSKAVLVHLTGKQSGGEWNWNAFANGFLMPFRKIGQAIPIIGEPIKFAAEELNKLIPEKDRYFK